MLALSKSNENLILELKELIETNQGTSHNYFVVPVLIFISLCVLGCLAFYSFGFNPDIYSQEIHTALKKTSELSGKVLSSQAGFSESVQSLNAAATEVGQKLERIDSNISSVSSQVENVAKASSKVESAVTDALGKTCRVVTENSVNSNTLIHGFFANTSNLILAVNDFSSDKLSGEELSSLMESLSKRYSEQNIRILAESKESLGNFITKSE
jgi:ABC-type transporter Mla subunit MlaD